MRVAALAWNAGGEFIGIDIWRWWEGKGIGLRLWEEKSRILINEKKGGITKMKVNDKVWPVI